MPTSALSDAPSETVLEAAFESVVSLIVNSDLSVTVIVYWIMLPVFVPSLMVT